MDLDHLLNRACYWASDHPWRMCTILCVLCLVAPCWISEWIA